MKWVWIKLNYPGAEMGFFFSSIRFKNGFSNTRNTKNIDDEAQVLNTPMTTRRAAFDLHSLWISYINRNYHIGARLKCNWKNLTNLNAIERRDLLQLHCRFEMGLSGHKGHILLMLNMWSAFPTSIQYSVLDFTWN